MVGKSFESYKVAWIKWECLVEEGWGGGVHKLLLEVSIVNEAHNMIQRWSNNEYSIIFKTNVKPDITRKTSTFQTSLHTTVVNCIVSLCDLAQSPFDNNLSSTLIAASPKDANTAAVKSPKTNSPGALN